MTGLQPDPQTEDVPVDRTISPIAGRMSGTRGKAAALAGLLVGCGVLAAAAWRPARDEAAPPPRAPVRQVVAYEPAPFAPPAAPVIEPTVPPITELAGASQPPAPAPSRRSPMLAYAPRGFAPDTVALAPTAAPPPPATELEALRRGSAIGRATARRLGDRSFLILAGATIPCILQTALDSSTPGYATCLVASDVWSDNGAVVLLDKGTRVLGEYRGGLRTGDRRLFVLWTRAVTPEGVAIDLASPAADGLGRGGFGGQVDTRFWERFGAALLLSIVDGGTAVIAGTGTDSTGVGLPSQAAAMAVEGAGQVRPVLRVPQGAEVSILTAQDFDFSGVYGLKARAP